VYKNGELVAHNRAPESVVILEHLLLGTIDELHFDGLIDEVILWQKALSDDQIQYLYHGNNHTKKAEVTTTTEEPHELVEFQILLKRLNFVGDWPNYLVLTG